MKNFWEKVKNFFRLITPWIKWGIKEFNDFKTDLKLEQKAQATQKAKEAKKETSK